MSLHRFRALVDRMSYPFWTIEAGVEGLTVTGEGTGCAYYLRVGNPGGRCNRTGAPMPWWGRKWRLSPHMTDGEVVWTALKAVLTAHEHEARELFTFDGVAIGKSHVDIHKLVALMRDPAATLGRPDTLSTREPRQ